MKNIKALLKYHVCLVSGFNIYLASNELHESATIVMPDRPLQNYTVGILFDRPNNNNKNILSSNQRNIKAILSRSYLWHIDVIAFRKKHIIPAIFQVFVKKELQQKHKPKGGSSWKDMKIHSSRLSLNYGRLGCHFRHSKQTSSNIQNLQLQTDVKMLQALFLRTIVFRGNSPSSNNQNHDFQKQLNSCLGLYFSRFLSWAQCPNRRGCSQNAHRKHFLWMNMPSTCILSAK